jgi:hypothetical protein
MVKLQWHAAELSVRFGEAFVLSLIIGYMCWPSFSIIGKRVRMLVTQRPEGVA